MILPHQKLIVARLLRKIKLNQILGGSKYKCHIFMYPIILCGEDITFVLMFVTTK